ncbi:hypothetical protein CHU_0342 [Cytophaga hutchinsonii ATCC 33406]|uniref:Uncharacterized protein n=1 Tax=Cytophaga hutchinsonii (strain ATCC 33406 / DSM 1761 / CIP 103989 / NBRC 15051 / NCIMB 9469 / D465) TaxID=269798 RepID=A0A6N4SMX7_CYTH3|nr:hypothetical protein CHU_0342 [Cytophaga hutchinsonii ATCC 33406]
MGEDALPENLLANYIEYWVRILINRNIKQTVLKPLNTGLTTVLFNFRYEFYLLNF